MLVFYSIYLHILSWSCLNIISIVSLKPNRIGKSFCVKDQRYQCKYIDSVFILEERSSSRFDEKNL